MHRTLLALGLLSGFWAPLAAQSGAALEVLFGTDTVYACASAPLTLEPSVSGGSGVYQFAWNTGSQGASEQVWVQAGYTLFTVTVFDGSSSALASVVVAGLTECVLPGDMNGDGAANNFDVLAWGFAAGSGGPVRPDAHTAWIAQGAPAWAQQIPSGADYAHSDADGNGIIDTVDLTPVRSHYAIPQSAGSLSAPGGPLLDMALMAPVYGPGDTLRTVVSLGTQGQPADSVYGIAFSLVFSGLNLDSSTLRVEYGSSWLGTFRQDLHGLHKFFFSPRQLDVAITRNDQTSRSGFGRVADISVMIDDVIGKGNEVQSVEIQVRNVRVLRQNGQALAVSYRPAEFLLESGQTQHLGLQETAPSLQAIRQPGRIELTSSLPMRHVRMLGLRGEMIYDVPLLAGGARAYLQTEGLPAGLYYILAETRNGTARTALMIR